MPAFPVSLLVIVLLVAAAGAAAAEPDSGREGLARRLAAIDTYSADFSQEIRGAQGQVLERSSGAILLQRPRFRWQVNQPYPQVIVTDGELLKVYDPDLEQLTIRPMAEALDDTPISLLTQDGVALGDDFTVEAVEDELGASYILTPTSAETLYAEIRLHFSDGTLTGLDITDHLGQSTEILFSPAPGPAVIESSAFTLTVPPGTDVIGG